MQRVPILELSTHEDEYMSPHIVSIISMRFQIKLIFRQSTTLERTTAEVQQSLQCGIQRTQSSFSSQPMHTQRRPRTNASIVIE